MSVRNPLIGLNNFQKSELDMPCPTVGYMDKSVNNPPRAHGFCVAWIMRYHNIDLIELTAKPYYFQIVTDTTN